MEGGINPDAILDFVEFHIHSNQNRYEANVWSNNIEENVVSGPLDLMLLHLPEIKNLSSKGSSTKLKVLPPESVNDVSWFTTTTLLRFLRIIGLPDILTAGNEISQLEETRKFQFSLSDKAEVDITTSVESKNELLQAVDLRLAALKEELADVINQAIGSKSSPKDISDLANFAFHFGAKDLRDILQKLSEIERHSSTEDEDSRFSSEEDQPSVERSRGLTRSAMPRRSASPMRRIQIGRSGSRRAAALNIKSLNVFPKSASQRDAAGNISEDEDSQRPPKSNALKMSVQDKISLFESKQKDQGIDTQKTKPTVGANKAILKRWITGSGTSTGNSSPSSSKNLASEDKTESDRTINKTETCAETLENISPLPEKGTSHQLGLEAGTVESERDWSEEKEAALDDPTKLMDSKPVRHQNANIVDHKGMDPKEQKGGLYELYKHKREEPQFKETHKPIDEKKGKMAANKVSGVSRRQNELQKSQKNSTQLLDSRTTKASAVKKSSLKSSPLPASRKSWPSTPSPQASGASPARTPSRPTSTSSTPTNRKPHPTGKMEKLQPQLRTPKATQPNATKRTNTINQKKKQPIGAENKKITKTNVPIPKEDVDATATAKPSFYNKVTRKNSVVPLETKPFLRKGSGIGRGPGPAVNKTKVVGQKTEDNVVTRIGTTSQNKETELELSENSPNIDLEPQVVRHSPTKCEESERNCSSVVGPRETEWVVSDINITMEEEVVISPTAWVVSEEIDQDEIIPCKESLVNVSSPASVTPPAGFSHPRVRHSLSQMFSEDSNKADIGEWGNAEHHSTLIYQKDAPRGLKRLLKFSRKAKADLHVTAWSNSPSTFSEGEDDADEPKGLSNFSRFNEQNHVSASMNTTKAFRANKMKETKVLHH
uniref:uncharacterized protein LOC122603115 isoform X2 n=1 Tax=Erigeron canadensis TaxID=72917 RepID=UPI001CB962D6|nr:uncharacterized protein LOC122603115 isoform X2 [Erigeron canadensis]